MTRLFLVLLFCSASFAVTPFPQARHHRVVLSERSSPYLLESSFVLSESDTLLVEPGVEVFFSGYAKLYLRGTVLIEGSAEKPVVFLSADSTESWNGLYFSTGERYFRVTHLRIENAFRNTIIRSRGIFENVEFVNNYYGLWVENSPGFELFGCDFSRNRFALSVGVGTVRFRNTKIHDNVFGLYLYRGTSFDGDSKLVLNNLEADIRKESDEMAAKGRKVSKNVWQRIEAEF